MTIRGAYPDMDKLVQLPFLWAAIQAKILILCDLVVQGPMWTDYCQNISTGKQILNELQVAANNKITHFNSMAIYNSNKSLIQTRHAYFIYTYSGATRMRCPFSTL